MKNVKSIAEKDMDVVIAELERNLSTMELNYRRWVTNLKALKQSVEKDDLTRLLRRGAFMKKLKTLLEPSLKEEAQNKDGHKYCPNRMTQEECVVMMIDIDHFKKVNDSYGHQTGDDVLKRVCKLINQYMRPGDLAGRYGGEEIIVGMQASMSEAMNVAENIRRAVQAKRMKSSFSDRAEFHVTLSVGVASAQEFGFEADRLIQKADEALYIAKARGRNRVISAYQEKEKEEEADVDFNIQKAA